MRIAVAQFSCESNTFATFRCDLETVRRTGYVHEGPALFALRGTDTELSGALSVLDANSSVEVVPLAAIRWNSSSVLEADAHTFLRGLLVVALRAAGPVDGVLISCHGSMVATDSDDPEGLLAAQVRSVVGPEVPVAMTLDLHGNVTDRMVGELDLIVGYEHYPHDDCFPTGAKAARLLLRTVLGEIRPVTCRIRLPMILTAFNASTFGDGPFARLERATRAMEREAGMLSASMFYVGSYIDLPEMGCSVLVIADDDAERAHDGAARLAASYWADRQQYIVDTLSVGTAIERGRAISGGPVILLNAADTTGGGAAGDSIDVAAGLVKAGVTEPALAMVVDPDAAAACHQAGVGATVKLELGHRVDPRWGVPATLEGEVMRLSDGRFTYTGGIFGGTEASMGPSAVLRMGSLELLVMTSSSYDWCDEQYRSMGLDPAAAKWIEAKNMMNFRRAYGDILKAAFVLDCPGSTPPDMRSLPFVRAQRPWFPLDDIDAPRFEVAVHEWPAQ